MSKNVRRNFRNSGSAIALAVMISLCSGGAALAGERTVTFNIPAETTAQALMDFSHQAGVQILYPYDVAANHQTGGLHGEFTVDAALTRLLAGSGLEVAARSDGSISLRAAGDKSSPQTAAASGDPSTEVIVTGTRIRNSQPTSPSHVITRTDIEQSGYSQVGDLIRSLPENFSGGQNPGVIGASAANIGNQNLTNSSTINLRGLGTDATLVLLNNHRLSADSFFQGADISAIPLSAVQRIEIVPDGASAIYGSDAVAGVANFIMRKDYNGTELRARFGGASQGGAGEQTYSVLSGRAEADGYFLGDLEYSRQGAVRAGERDFAAGAPADEWLLRPQQRKSFFFSSGHEFSDNVNLSFDGLISDRQAQTLSHRTASAAVNIGNVYTPSYSAASTLDVGLGGGWNLHVTGAASGSRNSTWTGKTKAAASFTYRQNAVQYGEVTADGVLLHLPSGDVKTAVGGGYRTELYHNNHPGSSSYVSGSRHVAYAYAEAFVPLVEPSLTRTGLHSLDVSLSARTEHYSDFGSTTNPKIGIRYVPVSGLSLRASWGTSFKAPSFTQMYQASVLDIWQASTLGYKGAGTAFELEGGNPDLKPEKSRSWTFGGDFTPARWRTMKISATYFDIDYTDRVVQPVPNLAVGLSDPTYAAFVEAPTAARLAQISSTADTTQNFSGAAYDPSTVVAILHDNYQNATAQTVKGVDVSYRQTFLIPAGRLDAFAGATWLRLKQQTVPAAPVSTLSGTLFNAPDFKARGGMTWEDGNWSATGIVNFIDGETDTGLTPVGHIASWTTVDATLIYQFGGDGAVSKGLKLIASASNLFDRNPPKAISPATTYPGLAYDSTNASILGRFASLTVVKAW